jgi:hypothetical protein
MPAEPDRFDNPTVREVHSLPPRELPIPRAMGVLGTLLLIAVCTTGCSDAYAPPAGANTSPSNLNVQITIEEAWTAATNQPAVTSIDLIFTLAGTSRPIDLTADGTVVCQDKFVSFSSGSYRFHPDTPPSAYTCTYTHNSNNQKASFTIPHEPAPEISSPRNGALLPSNTGVPIVYHVITPAHSEVGIAVLTTIPTSTWPDSDFHQEPGTLKFQTPIEIITRGGPSQCSRQLSITRRFRSAPSGTGFHSIAVLYDVYTVLLVTYAGGC